MLLVSTRVMYSQDNKFELKEIYVSDGAETYVLRKQESYMPVSYPVPLEQIYDSAKNMVFSGLGFGPMREYNDEDAKSLAMYFQKKISEVNMSIPNAEKTLYEVLCNFGEEYERPEDR